MKAETNLVNNFGCMVHSVLVFLCFMAQGHISKYLLPLVSLPLPQSHSAHGAEKLVRIYASIFTLKHIPGGFLIFSCDGNLVSQQGQRQVMVLGHTLCIPRISSPAHPGLFSRESSLAGKLAGGIQSWRISEPKIGQKCRLFLIS